MTPRLPLLFAFLGALLTFSGCAHYQLGTTPAGKLGFATIYVEPVENKTLLPQARALLSAQLRTAFEHDGRVALVNSAAEADVTLSVVIQDYHRDIASVLERDTGLARKFTLTLGLACTLHDRRAGRDLFTARPVSAQRDAFVDGGQLQSEYQALPLLAEDAAQKISHAVLDVW